MYILIGMYMATTGNDCQMKVWDLRQLKEVYSYYCPSTRHSSISQTGLLAYSNNK